MKILLTEDHAPTREHVAALLTREEGFEVVAQVGTAEEAIDAARLLKPDVVVMDILLPGMNGIEATQRILAERPETRVIAFSNHSGQALLQTILDAGGVGYVSKNRAFEELVPAIRAAVAGMQCVGRNVA